jgi:hypothetical protein
MMREVIAIPTYSATEKRMLLSRVVNMPRAVVKKLLATFSLVKSEARILVNVHRFNLSVDIINDII